MRDKIIPDCPSCGYKTTPGEKFCRQCGTPLAGRDDSHVPTQKDKKKSPSVQLGVLAVAVILFVYLVISFLGHLPGGDHPVIAGQPFITGTPPPGSGHTDGVFVDVEIADGNMVIPVSVLLKHRMIEFEYRDANSVVPLLAYISGEGRLVTSFRMCEPCNSRKFSIEGAELACGNCETRWDLNTLEGIQGNCQKYPPDPFPSRIVNDSIIIDLTYVKNWKIRL